MSGRGRLGSKNCPRKLGAEPCDGEMCDRDANNVENRDPQRWKFDEHRLRDFASFPVGGSASLLFSQCGEECPLVEEETYRVEEGVPE